MRIGCKIVMFVPIISNDNGINVAAKKTEKQLKSYHEDGT